MYLKKEENGNMIYSIDMLRLKTYITYSAFTELEFRLKTIWQENVKRYYTTGKMCEFFYNYVIQDEDGKSFWFGFLHNTEKRTQSDLSKYNLTIEFNPNKLKDNEIVRYILNLSGEWFIKSYDLAVDVKVNIRDLIVNKGNKRKMYIQSYGNDNITYRVGTGDMETKVYNKKRESNLDIFGDLTRIEISRTCEDYPISEIARYQFGNNFPEIYLNQYVMSLSQYQDKTLSVHLFALQQGYPLNDMTRTYKNKLKDMFEGGYKINFYQKYANSVLQQVIYHYFVPNLLMRWR